MRKIGFLTNALVSEGISNIEEMAVWAVHEGFNALEVGPNLPLDEAAFAKVIDRGEISISALTYCRNYLSSNQEEAQAHRRELIHRIRAAGRLGIPVIVTSTGIKSSPRKDHYDNYDAIRPKPERSLDEVVRFLTVALEEAEQAGVKLALENCPLMGNIAISPAMWKVIFERLDSPNLGLAYDPSHLLWQMADPYTPLHEYKDKILHVHAKDTEIDRAVLARTGILTDFSWWRYRLPGLGELNWAKFISILEKNGFGGMISIEHEDPVWGGSIEKIQEGIRMAKHYLDNLHEEEPV